MNIDNKHRSISWEKIAKEFQSERDALRNDLLRIQEERNNLLMRLRWRETAQITHYPGCWKDHYNCAMARIEDLEKDKHDLLLMDNP